MFHTVYILECADQTLYTGSAKNITKRIHAHNTTTAGAKYTRVRRPVRLVYSEVFHGISAARKREVEIKKLSRAEKLALIKMMKPIVCA